MANCDRKLLSERRLHYRLISRIYALCRSGDWSLRLARLLGGGNSCIDLGLVDEHGEPNLDIEGTVDEVRHAIVVEYRTDLMSTFIHECLHILCGDRFGPDEQDKEEAWVLLHEGLVREHLSPVQARRLLRLMVRMLE